MENLNTIHKSDNINIKYGECDGKKIIIIELQSSNKKSRFIITIDLYTDNLYDLILKNDYTYLTHWRELNNCGFKENVDKTIFFQYGGHILRFPENKAPNYTEILNRFIIFSKYNSLQDLEYESLIDKAFVITEPKLKEMINKFIEYFYPEEKQNNLTRTLKPKE